MSEIDISSIHLDESNSQDEAYKLFKTIDDYDFTQFRHVLTYGCNDINVRNKEGSTLLMHMVRQTKEGRDYKNFIVYVIMRGIDVNRSNRYGYTPLMHACMKNMHDMVELICLTSFTYACTNHCNKVNVNRQDKQGRTALMFAAKYSDNTKVIKLLFKYCAASYLEDVGGKTAIDYAKTKSLKRCIKNNGKSAIKGFFI